MAKLKGALHVSPYGNDKKCYTCSTKLNDDNKIRYQMIWFCKKCQKKHRDKTMELMKACLDSKEDTL